MVMCYIWYIHNVLVVAFMDWRIDNLIMPSLLINVCLSFSFLLSLSLSLCLSLYLCLFLSLYPFLSLSLPLQLAAVLYQCYVLDKTDANSVIGSCKYAIIFLSLPLPPSSPPLTPPPPTLLSLTYTLSAIYKINIYK